jgi:hypothetical protein
MDDDVYANQSFDARHRLIYHRVVVKRPSPTNKYSSHG